MKDLHAVPARLGHLAAFTVCRWRALPLLGAISLTAGCATSYEDAGGPAPSIVSESLAHFEGHLGADGTQREIARYDGFLELPSDVREYLDREVAPLEAEHERYRALRNWAMEAFGSGFEYDPTYTSPIQELPSSGKINCFSFSNMFVAAARYSDIPASFQLVDTPPHWDINRETWVLSQHINVSGMVHRELTDREKEAFVDGQMKTGTRISREPPEVDLRSYVVDLNPEIAEDGYRSRAISDSSAMALFHSNRSVEELLAGNLDEAMAHGRAAIAADEQSPTAWNNFGVLLSRQGRYEDAKQAYRTAMALDPDGEIGSGNLERVYRRTGESKKADALAKRVYANRMKNPYYLYALGERSAAMGELQAAVDHFKDAIRRNEGERLFYYALAEMHIRLGDYKKAAKVLGDAAERSTARDLDRYRAVSYLLAQATAEG